MPFHSDHWPESDDSSCSAKYDCDDTRECDDGTRCAGMIAHAVEHGTSHTNPKRKRGNDLPTSLALRVCVNLQELWKVMCGIVGVIDLRGRPLPPFDHQKVLSAIAHRGPDDHDVRG